MRLTAFWIAGAYLLVVAGPIGLAVMSPAVMLWCFQPMIRDYRAGRARLREFSHSPDTAPEPS